MRILDTDHCVEILRGNREVITYRGQIDGEVSTTCVTAAELYFGAAKSAWPLENKELVDRFLATLRVLPLGTAATQLFGVFKANLEDRGTPVNDADVLIASIARAEAAILVSGNRCHYERIEGLEIESWVRRAAKKSSRRR